MSTVLLSAVFAVGDREPVQCVYVNETLVKVSTSFGQCSVSVKSTVSSQQDPTGAKQSSLYGVCTLSLCLHGEMHVRYLSWHR